MVAEFATSDELLAAAGKTREAGYVRTDAHVPFPVHGLAEALGSKAPRLPLAVLCGGIAGALAGYGLQYWVSVLEYPVNIGGRPYHSWPSFVAVIFECTILGAALTAVFGMILGNRLPEPYHPVFNTPGFERASDDGFFLCIEAADPRFDAKETRTFLEGLGAKQVHEVEP